MSYQISIYSDRYFSSKQPNIVLDEIMQDIFNPLYVPEQITTSYKKFPFKTTYKSKFSLPAKSLSIKTKEYNYVFRQDKQPTYYKLPIELLPEYLFDRLDGKTDIYESLLSAKNITTFYVNELLIHIGIEKLGHNISLTNSLILLPYHKTYSNLSLKEILKNRLKHVKNISIYDTISGEFVNDITLKELEQMFIKEYGLSFLSSENIKILTLVFGNPSILFYQTIYIPDYIITLHMLEYLYPKKIFSV